MHGRMYAFSYHELKCFCQYQILMTVLYVFAAYFNNIISNFFISMSIAFSCAFNYYVSILTFQLFIYFFFIYFSFLINFIVYEHSLFRNLMASSSFEQIDKRRTSGRIPSLKVVVSGLDKVTFNTSSDITDSFDLNMIKPSSNLKNTNGVICTHYKLSNIKILEVSSLA